MKKHFLDKPILRELFWFIVLPYQDRQHQAKLARNRDPEYMKLKLQCLALVKWYNKRLAWAYPKVEIIIPMISVPIIDPNINKPNFIKVAERILADD